MVAYDDRTVEPGRRDSVTACVTAQRRATERFETGPDGVSCRLVLKWPGSSPTPGTCTPESNPRALLCGALIGRLEKKKRQRAGMDGARCGTDLLIRKWTVAFRFKPSSHQTNPGRFGGPQ